MTFHVSTFKFHYKSVYREDPRKILHIHMGLPNNIPHTQINCLVLSININIDI